MKAQKCKIRLHGSRREILTGEFESVSAAKKWIRDCWDRPYTIVKIKTIAEIKQRLEELRIEIRAERISTGEIIELQSLAKHIDEGDVELLQWAGVEEFTS